MASSFVSSVWEFDSEDRYGIHEAIRWYGKLPQKLVRRLIPMYSGRGDTVMANFAGSGTVVTEANVAGRDAVGSDTHPLSVLTNRVKANRHLPRDIGGFVEAVRRRPLKKPRMRFEGQYKWFAAEALSQIDAILAEIGLLKSRKAREFYTLALSQIIRSVSRTDSRCVNHIIVDSNKKALDAIDEFERAAHGIAAAIREYRKMSTGSRMDIRQMDARRLGMDDGSVDLMISHPPYANAVLYYNIYGLVSNILGHDYDAIRRSDMSSGGFEGYLDNMQSVLRESHRVIRPGGYEVLIVGDIRKNGDILTAMPCMVNTGAEAGFRLEDIFIWRLRHKAGMSVARRGNHIDHNYMLVFQKK